MFVCERSKNKSVSDLNHSQCKITVPSNTIIGSTVALAANGTHLAQRIGRREELHNRQRRQREERGDGQRCQIALLAHIAAVERFGNK